MASTFPMKTGDTAPSIALTLTRNQTAIDLTNASSVNFLMRAADATATKVDAAATIVAPTTGVVQYDWATGDTDTVGTYNIECKITWADGSIESVPNTEDYDQVVITRGLR